VTGHAAAAVISRSTHKVRSEVLTSTMLGRRAHLDASERAFAFLGSPLRPSATDRTE
jgi:hypothetical protein